MLTSLIRVLKDGATAYSSCEDVFLDLHMCLLITNTFPRQVVLIVLSVLHHTYYSWLNGKSVGDTSAQQWSLRLGNLFAVSVGLTLKVAVGNAYFQYIWGHLKRRAFSLGALNNLFDATGNLVSILSPEIITKATVGFLLVLLLWYGGFPFLMQYEVANG